MAKKKLDKSVVKDVRGGENGYIKQVSNNDFILVDENNNSLIDCTFENIESAIKAAVLYEITLPDYMTNEQGIPIAPNA